MEVTIHSQNGDIALGVTNGETAAVFAPPKAIEWAWVLLLELLAFDGALLVTVDVPHIDIALRVTGGEHTWMCWTPLSIIDILLRAFECIERLKLGVGAPKFDSPIHGTGEQQLIHLSMLLTLAHSRMHMHRCDRSIMPLDGPLDELVLLHVALVNVVVFRADIEDLLITLCEVKTVSVDW